MDNNLGDTFSLEAQVKRLENENTLLRYAIKRVLEISSSHQYYEKQGERILTLALEGRYPTGRTIEETIQVAKE